MWLLVECVTTKISDWSLKCYTSWCNAGVYKHVDNKSLYSSPEVLITCLSFCQLCCDQNQENNKREISKCSNIIIRKSSPHKIMWSKQRFYKWWRINASGQVVPLSTFLVTDIIALCIYMGAMEYYIGGSFWTKQTHLNICGQISIFEPSSGQVVPHTQLQSGTGDVQ